MTFIQHPPHQAQVINFPRRPQQAPRRQAPRRANRFDRAKLGYIHWQRCEVYYDDEASRIMLTALLHCGLSRKQVLDRAPWVTRAELDAMQRMARKLAFDDLGPFIQLTKAEWKLYKAWRFRPLGVSWEEIEEERRKKRRGATMIGSGWSGRSGGGGPPPTGATTW